MADEAWLASEVVRLRRRQDILERAAQIAHSTVEVPDGADGVVDMTVPTALGRGVQAQWDAKAVDEKLDTARAELEAAQAELDDKLADAELGLEGANQRLNDAEDAIGDAFLGIDEAITLADQAKSNMPNRVDDPDFSFGDKYWEGTGGQFIDLGTTPVFTIGLSADASKLVAETAVRMGSTNGRVNWTSDGSTYELRLEGAINGSGMLVHVEFGFDGHFGNSNAEGISWVQADLTSDTVAMPIRLPWSYPGSGPLSVRITGTTDGVSQQAAISSVSVTDVTTITEVKATADAALVSANGKQNILHGINSAPSGTAADGSIWWNHKDALAGPVQGQWAYISGSWVETPVDSEAIANLDVGKLTAGGAVIAEVVAQAIASATASFQRADIKNLFVTAGATINEAVIDKLWADVVVARMLVADKIISSEAIVDELVGKVITAVVMNGGTITGATVQTSADPNAARAILLPSGVLQSRAASNGEVAELSSGQLAFFPTGGASALNALYTAFGITFSSNIVALLSAPGGYTIDASGGNLTLGGDRIDLNTSDGVYVNREEGGSTEAAVMFTADKVELSNTLIDTSAGLDTIGLAFTGAYPATVSAEDSLNLDAGNGVYVNGFEMLTTDWENIPLAAGMGVQSGSTPQVRLKFGTVYIRGAVSGSISSGTKLGTLPEQYRCGRYIRAASPTSAGVSQRININEGGEILGNFGGNTVTWQSLDGIVPYSID
ncbi:hypothetical protein [Paramicrobacterium chengjingii]|uniref:hypothetical protein n=1 Tax=Paramicrobacterium chengjingii TaxID=2769067 RepID=UPI00141D851D|nr:hypothetical protein [Microbacterium chengjingii]